MKSIEAKVFFIDENKQVGKGSWEGTMPAKTLYDFKLPIRFQYDAVNSSDTTCSSPFSVPSVPIPKLTSFHAALFAGVDFYDACQHIWTGTVRSTLKLRLELEMQATGRIGTSSTSTQISNIDCP